MLSCLTEKSYPKALQYRSQHLPRKVKS